MESPRGFDEFERAVMEMLLSGSHPILEELRRQYGMADVDGRKFTGHGFYVDFALDREAAPRTGAWNLQISDVGAELPGLAHGAGFVLFVREGWLAFLEGFAYDEPWPDSVDGFQLTYPGGEARAGTMRELDEALRESRDLGSNP